MATVVLSLGQFGDQVSDLQRRLQAAGFEVPSAEAQKQVFGAGTRDAVSKYQAAHNMVANGVVDDVLAKALGMTVAPSPPPGGTGPVPPNSGGDSSPPSEFQFLVRGQVMYLHGLPIPGLTVRAFNKELRTEDLLNSAVTDADGNYEIWYSPDKFSRKDRKQADLIVRAYSRTAPPPAAGTPVAQPAPSSSVPPEHLLVESPIIFNAQTIEKVRLYFDGGPTTVWSEYEQLFSEVQPLVQTTPIATLTETKQQPDVTFLSGNTGQDSQRTASLVVGHKLAGKTGLAPEIFYGLARAGLPTNLSALLSHGPDALRTHIQAAVSRRLIPGRLAGQAPQLEAQILQATAKLAASKSIDPKQASIGDLLATSLPEEAQRIDLFTRYLQHTGPITQFWNQLSQDPAYKDRVGDLQLTLQLGALVDNHLPLVAVLQKMRQAGQFQTVRALAGFTQKQWEQIVLQPAVPEDQLFPPDIPGKDKQTKAQIYAATIRRVLDDALPSDTFAYRVQADETQPADVRTFFKNVTSASTGFDLLRSSIPQALASHPELLKGVQDPKALQAKLSGLQRISKLTPRYDAAQVLISNGLDSAFAITRLNRDTFAEQYKNAFGTRGLAGFTYDTASHVVASAINLLANFDPSFSKLELRVLKTPDPSSIPNLQTLFGSLDLCDCSECRSVYSPAAYLAELLAWLAERHQLYFRGEIPVSTNARDILFERRPDIGDIELTCDNTNLPLPYIDLVNELLEDLVSPFAPFTLAPVLQTDLDNETLSPALITAFATQNIALDASTCIVVVGKPGAVWFVTDYSRLYAISKEGSNPITVVRRVYQTQGSADELGANPQHSNDAAYQTLRGAIFPWTLPLDLWWEETRAYLAHLGVKRDELMADFRAAEKITALSDTDIASEYLALHAVEHELIANGRSVRVATTAALPGLTGTPAVDGIALTNGDLVLVKDQPAAGDNGLYVVGAGAWTRDSQDVSLVAVASGTANAGTYWLVAPGDIQAIHGWDAWGLKQSGNAVQVFDPASKGLVTKSLGWLDALAQVRVVLDRAQLAYEELLALLDTHFINAASNITIESSDPDDPTACDTSRLVLKNFDEKAADRLHRFVRLWRHLGWSAHDLDHAISVFAGGIADVNARLSDPLVLRLSHVQRLNEALMLPVETLLAFWSNIDLEADPAPGGQASLYVRLFQNPEVTRPVDPAFALSGGELAIVTGSPADAKISKHVPTILAALGLGADELTALTSEAVTDDNLDLANLSKLYRYTQLAHATSLPIADLLTLCIAAGIDPFDAAHTEDAVLFLDLLANVRGSGFGVDEVDYLLRHNFSNASPLAPQLDAIAQMLSDLRGGLKKVQDQTAVQADPSGNVTAQKLALLQWPAEQIQQIVDTLNERVVYIAPLAVLPPGTTFPASLGGRVSYDSTGAQLKITGPMTLTQWNDLRNASMDGAYQSAVDQLFHAPRTFVGEQLKAYALPTFSTPLPSLPTGLVFPRPVNGRIYYDAPAHTLFFSGRMTDSEQTLLKSLSTDASYSAAIDALYAAPASFAPTGDNVFLISADIGQLFDGPMTPEARFGYVLGKLLGHLRSVLSSGTVVQRLSDNLKLEARTVDELVSRQLNALGFPGQKAIADLLDPAYAQSDVNVALTPTAFPNQFNTVVRLQKAALLIGRLRLTADQVVWLRTFGSSVPQRAVTWIHGAPVTSGWLVLDDLPAAPAAASPARFAGLLRLVSLASLRDQLPHGAALLGNLFQAARVVSPAPTEDALLQILADGTGWDKDDLAYIAGALGFTSPDDFKDEVGTLWLRSRMSRLKVLGVSAAAAASWTKTELTPQDGTAILNAVKAKYSENEWNKVSKPLRDVLRKRQRDALVDYLVPRPDVAKGQAWADVNGLYAYLLIDVEMDACMLTSRIKQAIGSVQLFVQRCLMNLEPEVKANSDTDGGWLDWQWMKAYRLWEANRKIFLYPENWLEPELRDDKSDLFTELESALLQGKITQDTASDAFLTYLEKLDGVARLEVAAFYQQDAVGSQPQVLHVFGRTRGAAQKYYYRQKVGDGRWTQWEQVGVDISEQQIIPIVWNTKLYLFWPVFTERNEQTIPTNNQPAMPTAYFDIQLAWSVRTHDKWQSKQLTPFKVTSNLAPDPSLADHGKSKHTFRARFDGPGLRIWYEYANPEKTITVPNNRYYKGGGTHTVHYAFVNGFFFTGCDNRVEMYTQMIQGIWAPLFTQVDGMMFTEVPSHSLYLPTQAAQHNTESKALRWSPGVFSLSYAYQDGYITGRRPFFYQDDAKTYYVEPTEVQIVTWQWAQGILMDPGIVDRIREVYYQPRQVADPLGPVAKLVNPVPIAMEQLKERVAPPAPATSSAPAAGAAILKSSQPSITEVHQKEVATEQARLTAMAPGSWILANGERRRMEISEYISDSRLYAPIYVSPTTRLELRYRFWNFYHPYVCSFVEQLNWKGFDGLFQRSLQLQNSPLFASRYFPTALIDRGDPAKNDHYPTEDVDFTFTGAYSQYNWELFFHAPLLIATRLSQNQQFEDAQRWFHAIFDPTDTTDSVVPRKYWHTRPFYEQSQDDYFKQRIDEILTLLAQGMSDPNTDAQVQEWRAHPFDPHAIARLRLAAYQKSVVMKYLDNLIAWGDQLFRQDTIESINEATQLYILAAEILGDRPRIIPPRAEAEVQTYNSMDPKLSSLSDKLVEIEVLVTPPQPDAVVVPKNTPPINIPRMLYFCVPPNDKLLGYWDTVADRLFKIRNCMNIQGVVRQLPLFEPPIEPGLLVKAAAAGMDLSSALNDINAPLPHYRFNVLAQNAVDLVNEVKSLGAALLSALEKRDAEDLALLKASQESALLALVEKVKTQQLSEAQQATTSLRASRAMSVARYLNYQKLLGVSNPTAPTEGQTIADVSPSAPVTISEQDGVKVTQYEQQELQKSKDAANDTGTASDMEFVASILNLIPNFSVNIEPWGVGASISFGGSNLGAALNAIANRYRSNAASETFDSSRASRLGQMLLRETDWVLQSNLASKEIMYIDQQLIGSAIKEQLAQKELDNHHAQMDQAAAINDFMTNKYTNRELYDWMVGQLSAVYFQAYQLSYDVAKRAERCFGFELGVQDTNYIQFGYWDSLRRGLLAGERLFQDLKQMQLAYLDKNQREYEIVKSVSLAQLHPEALVSLQESGSCFVEIPEAILDLDHPGHYMRRIKSVSVTIPCVAGPYTSVNCKLTLLGNRIRKETRATPSYPWAGPNDLRFVYDAGGIQSIVTSSARDDAGLFELNFRDERYLPFEGAGAISSWRLELPVDFRQFDYRTITDVILRVRYTARDGGEPLKQAALSQLNLALKQMELEEGKAGLYRCFSARQDYFDEWYRFMNPPDGQTTDQVLSLDIALDQFPAALQDRALKVDTALVFIRLKRGVVYSDSDHLFFNVQPPSGPAKSVELQIIQTELGGVPFGAASLGPGGIAVAPSGGATAWSFDVTQIPAALKKTVLVNGSPVTRLDPGLVDDVGVVVHYTY